MAYRNKTYVIFDGDNDMWAYAYMLGWVKNNNIEFNFHNAHELGSEITDRASEETVKRRLRERLRNAKQCIVIVGDNTKNLFRFVRWEIEVAMELDIPLIVVNLNGTRGFDEELCPPILRSSYSVHVPFKLAAIRHALEHFPAQYASRQIGKSGPLEYSDTVYKHLGI